MEGERLSKVRSRVFLFLFFACHFPREGRRAPSRDSSACSFMDLGGVVLLRLGVLTPSRAYVRRGLSSCHSTTGFEIKRSVQKHYKSWLSFDAAMAAAVVTSCTLHSYATYRYGGRDVMDSQIPFACRNVRSDATITENVTQILSREGIVVLELDDAVLNASELKSARQDVSAARHLLVTTGNDSNVRQDKVVRVNSTVIPDEEKEGLTGVGLMFCVDLLRGVTHSLLEHGYIESHTHLVPRHVQLAEYGGDDGEHYVSHLDACLTSVWEMGLQSYMQSRDARGRVLTCILYLNPSDWDVETSGGALSYQHVGGADADASTWTSISPRGGTMVIFDSRRIVHRVEPCYSTRHALTCWIMGQVDDV